MERAALGGGFVLGAAGVLAGVALATGSVTAGLLAALLPTLLLIVATLRRW